MADRGFEGEIRVDGVAAGKFETIEFGTPDILILQHRLSGRIEAGQWYALDVVVHRLIERGEFEIPSVAAFLEADLKRRLGIEIEVSEAGPAIGEPGAGVERRPQLTLHQGRGAVFEGERELDGGAVVGGETQGRRGTRHGVGERAVGGVACVLVG